MKKYLNEIENVERIMVFDELNEFLEDDEQGNRYFEDEGDFIWWKDLANALEKIEDHKQELQKFTYSGDIEDYHKEKEFAEQRLEEFESEINSSINELEDYIRIASRL